jgi:hypothetical protein
MTTQNGTDYKVSGAPDRRVFHLATLTTAVQNVPSRTSAPMITRFDRTLGAERHVSRVSALAFGDMGPV